MEWHKVAGKWNQMRGKVRQKWGKLTDDDLDLIEGDRDELIGRVRERYGYTRGIVERQIDEWTQSLGDLEGDAETDAPVRPSKAPKL